MHQMQVQTVAVEWSNISKEGYDRTWRFARLSYAFSLLGRSLKNEAAYSSETLVLVYQSTRCRDGLTFHKYLSFTQVQTRYRSTERRTNTRGLEMCSWNKQQHDLV
jgi:hypothetical protein